VGLVCLAASALAADPPRTEVFVAEAASGNSFEIESSKLALEKAKAADVRGFAEQMVAEHTAADTKLKEAVAEAKIKEPSFALSAKHQDIYEKLSKRSGGSFDRAYIEAQFQAHKETVELFEAYAADGDNPRVKRFAEHLLPALRLHLEHITKLWKAGSP
jgi:putative membrane protein